MNPYFKWNAITWRQSSREPAAPSHKSQTWFKHHCKKTNETSHNFQYSQPHLCKKTLTLNELLPFTIFKAARCLVWFFLLQWWFLHVAGDPSKGTVCVAQAVCHCTSIPSPLLFWVRVSHDCTSRPKTRQPPSSSYQDCIQFIICLYWKELILKKQVWGWRDSLVVRALAALAKDQDWIPNTHNGSSSQL